MEKLKDIDEQELAAFQHALTQSLVGIVGKDRNGEFGKSIGTGTFVEIGGDKCILTAAHVIENCASKEMRYFLPLEGMSLSEVPTLPTFEQLAMREQLIIDSVRSDEDLDVALLKLDPTVAIRKPWTFRRLRRVKFPPPEKSQFVMVGFPAERAQAVTSGSWMVVPNVDYPEVVDEKGLRDFNPEIHFLTDFPSADKFHPRGYSGSGLWGDEIGEGETVWKPNPIYLGMEQAYFPQRKLLRILGVNAIIDFIEGREP